MPSVGFKQILGQSWARTTHILFKTFSVKKWVWLLLISWLAGGISLSGGGPFSKSFNRAQKPGSTQVVVATSSSQSIPSVGPQDITTSETEEMAEVFSEEPAESAKPESESGENFKQKEQSQAARFFSKIKEQMGSFYWIVVFVMSGVLILAGLLFFWLQARFRFVWLNSILENEIAVRRPFKEYKKEGNSLFFFTVIFWCSALAGSAMIFAWIASDVQSSGVFDPNFAWSLRMLWQYFGRYALAVSLFVILYYHLLIFMIDFIVPIMLHDRCGSVVATGTFIKLILRHPVRFLLYYLIRLVVTFLLWITITIAIFASLVMIALLSAVLIGVPFFIFMMWLKMKFIFMVIAVMMAIPIILLSVFVVFSPSLPFAVFYRCYPLYFLATLEEGPKLVTFEGEGISGISPNVS